ncbi:HAMP domain-containing sensor histidine kinase [Proteiniphilum sp. UBA5384]|uniref:HAMP domain-containing sensor histidine kinase n=1 Tax=Proteiniphilum sp. UBA5384 TaxID=1947279 RepID=UPI0025D2403B|nr:HAMP domain-containing sensor histidine kinase [Proteiniphilum sp. UBA5384]
MKIRHKLTLRYTGVTAAIFSVVVLVVFFFSEHTREKEFFHDLTREAVTKANLFLSNQVDAATMQSIYHNNRQFIDEVEVAVYTIDFQLLYHDAQEIDIIKETPELIKTAIAEKESSFYEGKYQGIAMKYAYKGVDYVITAAAYDGYGYAKLTRLTTLLVILWCGGLGIIAVIGYLLAKGALRPVSRIVEKVDAIGESNLNTRLYVKKEYDELDELSETFNQMLDRLEQSFDNQKMFVSNVAHELRTPLAALIAELEVAQLREDRSEDEYRAVIVNALDDAEKLKHLTTGLLDLAKANYDISRISTEELRMDELLLDARETVLKGNKNYSVDLIFDQDAEDDRVITVCANAYLLKTAFINLIENNCKFSEDKSSDVQISFYEGKTIIRFSDTGIGISADEVEKIFIPFYRGSNTSHIKGQGIGLTLTQRIIQLHKGTLTIQTRKDEGTTFVVEIPHI